jgi:hypothetical protein
VRIDPDACADLLAAEVRRLHAVIARLRLTDAEREAVELAAEDCRYHQDPGGRAAFIEATLRGLLERLGVLPDREHPPRKDEATPTRSGETGDDSPDRA